MQRTETLTEIKGSTIERDIRDDEPFNDLSSDNHDIRQQAKQARDPEQGQNIL